MQSGSVTVTLLCDLVASAPPLRSSTKSFLFVFVIAEDVVATKRQPVDRPGNIGLLVSLSLTFRIRLNSALHNTDRLISPALLRRF
jgi:hypothetical protein